MLPDQHRPSRYTQQSFFLTLATLSIILSRTAMVPNDSNGNTLRTTAVEALIIIPSQVLFPLRHGYDSIKRPRHKNILTDERTSPSSFSQCNMMTPSQVTFPSRRRKTKQLEHNIHNTQLELLPIGLNRRGINISVYHRMTVPDREPDKHATIRHLKESPTERKKSSENATKNPRKSFKNANKRKNKLPSVGAIPDIAWRSIPLDHLRAHPSFHPLPTSILRLDNITSVSLFRQSSWQWTALHCGRCTTSQTSAALGILEPNAAEQLGIPRSLWRKGGIEAYRRLSQECMVDLSEIRSELLVKDDTVNDGNTNETALKQQHIWKKRWSDQCYPFRYIYLPPYIQPQPGPIQNLAKRPMSIRMAWGNAQEPTAILTALNFFTSKVDPQITLHEVGMCVLEDDDPLNALLTEGLHLGASPDALIRYPDGTMEALEVKNHCPFLPCRQETQMFRIRDFNRLPTHIPPLYIPQLMMEMVCLGQKCQSAVLLRQTATKGAIILRLHRDDDFIKQMLTFLGRFHQEFVLKGEPPPENFFWNEEDNGEYLEFVKRMAEIGKENVEFVGFVDHGKIQRANAGGGDKFVPLFLD